ncbi:hypothetical protein [Marinobacter shengliensis]|uniref:hypothetical protein n=1 Tax=Marinobacter shengliensis TaxID=1389223 RepID=UPI001107F54A|nr:hypothetical protein [Marinobacter shengliensis]
MTYKLGVILFAGLAVSAGFVGQMMMEESSSALSNRSEKNSMDDKPLEQLSIVECVNGMARLNLYQGSYNQNTPMTFNGRPVECEAADGQIEAYLVDGEELNGRDFGSALSETMNPGAGDRTTNAHGSPGVPTVDEAALLESIRSSE